MSVSNDMIKILNRLELFSLLLVLVVVMPMCFGIFIHRWDSIWLRSPRLISGISTGYVYKNRSDTTRSVCLGQWYGSSSWKHTSWLTYIYRLAEQHFIIRFLIYIKAHTEKTSLRSVYTPLWSAFGYILNVL